MGTATTAHHFALVVHVYSTDDLASLCHRTNPERKVLVLVVVKWKQFPFGCLKAAPGRLILVELVMVVTHKWVLMVLPHRAVLIVMNGTMRCFRGTERRRREQSSFRGC